LTFVVGLDGKPMRKESLGNVFREACDKAGCRGSGHGLRKAAATRLANAGASIHELNAALGWEGTKMASLYTKAADRERLAKSALAKLQKLKP
jgi:integrase